MNLIQSIIMGIVQGIAEFLPISSSGHLAIAKQVLDINTDTGLLFDVLLHIGTLIAIFVAFWKDIKELIVNGFQIIGIFFANIGRMFVNVFCKITGSIKRTEYSKIITTPYRRFVMLVIVSTIPTGIIGVLFKDSIEKASETLLIPGLCLILTGVLLIIADSIKPGKKTEENATYKNATFIGIAQGIATLPGLSRSGTTITACIAAGFDRSFAVKYSFIMSIPAILGALVLQLFDFSMNTVSTSELINYFVGMVVAAVIGYVSIKTMLVIVRGKKFKYFAYYCFVIGIFAVVANFVI
ncbi:MAG: undecaprenyl-diphosphate phosphatase [Mobilitalea sp.]